MTSDEWRVEEREETGSRETRKQGKAKTEGAQPSVAVLLDGTDGKRDDVVDLHQFFHQEGLTVTDSNHFAVVTRQ